MSNKIYYVFTVLLHITPSLSVKDSFSNATGIRTPSFLPACSGYMNSNYVKTNDITSFVTNINGEELNLTLNLPTVTAEHINFLLRKNQKLKCAEETAEIRVVSLSAEQNPSKPLPRHFDLVESGSTEPHSYSYFVSSGHFYDNTSSNYYKPDGDYCVASYSPGEEITLKVCAVNKDCSSSSNVKAWCIPKCCAADEVLLYWQRKCVQREEIVGVTPWIPPLFDGTENPNKKIENVQNNLMFHMATLPKDCKFKIAGKARYKSTAPVTVTHPKQNITDAKHPIKLAAPRNGNSGIVQPMGFFATSRRWKLQESWSSFCVDGFHVKTKQVPYYTGKEDNYVIYYCDDEEESNTEIYSWIYFLTSILSLLFLLVTLVVYFLLWEKQNLHGLSSLSYVAATFLSYLFLGMAHFATLFHIAESNERTPFCYTIAVLAHYFFISSYSWLTVINFDLWMTFKSVRPVKTGKGCKKMCCYSLFAWGVPLILVVAFIIVDETYRDPTSLVPVPDYGSSSCFVSADFRGQYLYIPMAIILGANIVLIGLTMKIFIDAKRKIAAFSGGVSNANHYSVKLFCKLFIVMGGTSLIDFLTWYYNNSDAKPWWIVAIESVSYLFTTVALFAIYCLNDKVINQLQETYPSMRYLFRPYLKLFSKQEKLYAQNKTVVSSSMGNTHEKETSSKTRKSKESESNVYQPALKLVSEQEESYKLMNKNGVSTENTHEEETDITTIKNDEIESSNC